MWFTHSVSDLSSSHLQEFVLMWEEQMTKSTNTIKKKTEHTLQNFPRWLKNLRC